MRRLKIQLLFITLLLGSGSLASASSILDGWLINIDGVTTSWMDFSSADATNFPIMVDVSSFSAGTIDNAGGGGQVGGGTGLGMITITFTTSGPHTVLLWLDHHLDEGSIIYWNDFASTSGTLMPGQTFQIDEAGYGDPNGSGYTGTSRSSIESYTNPLLPSPLDNTNHVPDPSSCTGPECPHTPTDVSIAMGQSFTLNPGQMATVSFVVGFSPSSSPTGLYGQGSRFYIFQNNGNVGGTVYMSEFLAIGAVPEPTTWVLMGGGLLALAVARRNSSRKAANN